MEKVLGEEGINLDLQKLFINWEVPLFWAILGVICGSLVARHYYKKTGADLSEFKDALFEKIDVSVGITEEGKASLKANIAGVFYTHSWEKEYAKKLGGGRGKQKLEE